MLVIVAPNELVCLDQTRLFTGSCTRGWLVPTATLTPRTCFFARLVGHNKVNRIQIVNRIKWWYDDTLYGNWTYWQPDSPKQIQPVSSITVASRKWSRSLIVIPSWRHVWTFGCRVRVEITIETASQPSGNNIGCHESVENEQKTCYEVFLCKVMYTNSSWFDDGGRRSYRFRFHDHDLILVRCHRVLMRLCHWWKLWHGASENDVKVFFTYNYSE